MQRNYSAVLLFLGLAIPALAQFNGAIQTTNSDASQVNINQYATKDLVYLTGGPQNLNGAGLPNGNYYFQLTSPDGQTLLSTDPAHCRQVYVTGGKVQGWFDDGSMTCTPHVNGTAGILNGETPVQVGITPDWFDTTPNNGGVYKLWLISQDAGLRCNPQIYSDAGLTTLDANGKYLIFAGGCKKTDNFKVLASACTIGCGGTPSSLITGLKYYDANTNGEFTAGEPVLGNWEIKVTYTDQGTLHTDESVFTDAGGSWSVAADQGSHLKACEVLPATWSQSGPLDGATSVPGGITAASKCWEGTVPTADTVGLTFGNYQQISGMKYFDGNRDGANNNSEAGIGGFTIQFAFCGSAPCNAIASASAVTASNGTWSYVLPTPDSAFRACEQLPSGWTQSGPLNGGTNPYALNQCWNGNGPAANLDFGNYIAIKGRKTYDPSGAGIASWPINVTCSGGTGSCGASTTTDGSGYYVIYPTGPITSYAVCEGSVAGYTQTYPTYPLTVNGATSTNNCSAPNSNGWAGTIGTATGSGIDFKNTIRLGGSKFYDADHDGAKLGVNETGIQGFKIAITYCTTGTTCTSGTTVNVYTDVNGNFTWTAPVVITSFQVCEILPPTGGWVQTTTPTCYTGQVGGTQTGLIFGNICQGPGGGLTLGFWSNKNGQSIETHAANTGWVDLLNGASCPGGYTCPSGSGQYLRNANANFYTVSTSANFNTWILGASATNMAYMLSAKTAAMELNVNMSGTAGYNGGVGKVNPNGFVYAGSAPASCTVSNLSGGFITVGNLLEAAVNASFGLRANGNTVSGADRACQEFVKTTIDNANNNKNFVQPKACSVPTY